MTQFENVITLYHKQGDVWTKTHITGVYYQVEYGESVNETERQQQDKHTCIIPTRTIAVATGDIIIKGECADDIADYGSGNNIIKQGGWFVRKVFDNRMANLVPHLEVSSE